MIEQFYNLRPDVLELDRKALELCREPFCHVEEIRDYNQLKMLRAFTDCGVEARHFWGSSGYGVWDDSRNKLEEVFARCMGAESALVRSQFMSGTHTLTVALFGLLRTGDTLLAATGRPYDTLEGVIGLDGKGKGTGTPVSYTHLDVYKRQGHNAVFIQEVVVFLSVGIRLDVQNDLGAHGILLGGGHLVACLLYTSRCV